MALALADSLIAHLQFDATDLMDRFVSWWKRGAYSCAGRCFDIGITTGQALARYMEDGVPYAGSTNRDTAGNGSLMRLSPVALHALHDASCREDDWSRCGLQDEHSGAQQASSPIRGAPRCGIPRPRRQGRGALFAAPALLSHAARAARSVARADGTAELANLVDDLVREEVRA
jgi:hypothetical protein